MPKVLSPAPPPIGTARTERLAVNLLDLDRVTPMIRQMLLGGKLYLSKERLVRADLDRLDEFGVEFSCDLLTAACCCDTLRSHDRSAGDYPTRVYLFRRAWSKVSGAAQLTVVRGGKVMLNPELFPGADVPQAVAAPVPRPVEW